MEDEEAQLQLLAFEDFKHALVEGGPGEAAATLASYREELRGAPESLLLQLAAAFRQHAASEVAASAATATAGAALLVQPLQPLLDLEAQLLRVVGASKAAVHAVGAAWDDAAVTLLYGQPGEEGAEAAVARLERLACSGSTQLAAQLLCDARMDRLPAPATHQQVCSLAACLLYLRLFPDILPGAPAGLADRLAAVAAPPWLGHDLRHAQQQMAAGFQALAGVLQCRSVRQRLDSLARRRLAAAHAAALRFLLLFRPAVPAAAELWWAHFAAVMHVLVSHRGQRGDACNTSSGGSGMAGLQSPALRHLVYSLCSQETAHMVVQLVLAHPAYQATAGSDGGGRGGAAAGGGKGGRGGRGGGGGRRRKATAAAAAAAGTADEEVGADGGGGSASRAAAKVREALGAAAELLAHDVPAFLSGCCELLRPEANAVLQTRMEVLAAMGRAASKFLEEEGEQQAAGCRSTLEEEGAEGNDSSSEGSSCQRGSAGARAAARAVLAPCLWLPAALDQLLFVARTDPSVRVRREAVKLLGTAVGGAAPQQEVRLVQAVLQRCRDRDEAVRREAFALLARFPQTSLERCLQLTDWQAVLDCGLAGPLPVSGGGSGDGGGGGGCRSRPASKHAAAIEETCGQLLLRCLGLGRGSCVNGSSGSPAGSMEVEEGGDHWESGSAGGEGAEDEDEGADWMQGYEETLPGTRSAGSHPAWVARLLALQPLLAAEQPPQLCSGPAAAVVDHLLAAWRHALEQVLEPVQLRALDCAPRAGGESAQEREEEREWEEALGGDGSLAEGHGGVLLDWG